MIFILMVVIGGVVGWLFSTFTEGRGLGVGGSTAVGIVGGLVSGLLFGMVGERIVGPGPVLIASLLASAIGALVLLLIVRLVRK